MIFRLFILLITIEFIVSSCSQVPEIVTDEIVDLSYNELKQQYITCKGKGVMTAKGDLPWKLNYSFTTQNDSSFIQFKDIFGRRVLFVQALPSEITLWEMQKNLQYDSAIDNAIPIFEILKSYDIAQILWGEIPDRFQESDEKSGFERDLNLVNFKSTVTQLGMVLDKVIFNFNSLDTIVEFKIFGRDYGEVNLDLLKGIPEQVPLN
ncbi:MAG: hypothetical protein GWP19_11865 [Planctomycetia bacterium]|nr:hypothetical protein [Planctomycetia bacterium]